MARKRQGLCPTSQNRLIHCQARGYLGGFLTQLPQTYNLPSLTLLCFLHTSPQLSISPFLSRIPEPSGHTSICSSQERILVPTWKEGLCWRKACLLVPSQEHWGMTKRPDLETERLEFAVLPLASVSRSVHLLTLSPATEFLLQQVPPCIESYKRAHNHAQLKGGKHEFILCTRELSSKTFLLGLNARLTLLVNNYSILLVKAAPPKDAYGAKCHRINSNSIKLDINVCLTLSPAQPKFGDCLPDLTIASMSIISQDFL